MTLKKVLVSCLGAAVLGGIVAGGGAVVAQSNEQFIPMLSYRVGPYAAGGTGIFGGFIDYINLLNERDGGINGVKITYEECETEYKPDRALECYERLKNSGPTGASMFNFVATPPVYATMDRTLEDKIPVVAIGYGPAYTADGRVFPYIFPLVTTYWSQNTAKIKFIALQEQCLAQYPDLEGKPDRAAQCFEHAKKGELQGDGLDKLKGKKIVNLYHDSGYGKETKPILDAQAEKYGFQVVYIPVPHPGNEQQSQWLQIRREKPDWVILRGWGVMNPTAITQAARIKFPADRIVGVWWSGAEEDVVPAGDAAIGFIAAALNPAGDQFPAIKQIEELLYSKGKGNMQDPSRVGSVYYNRGIIHGVLNTEAIRKAQEKFGNKPLTGEQVRWGLENLEITEARLKELGLEGVMSPIKISCADHEGGAPVRFHQWNGKQWVLVSDWIATDQSLVRPLVEKEAANYAKEKNLPIRDCSKES
ncbi:MAG: ABC transporter substrate-binding protein [Gammaproteobacteria bacterium]|nr:ABC transporter substrate-binding protein [Gammaproteobacteria bacterium]MCP5458933.1 ABC transporter substrate-binding protein [Gammaproteobacteria bacterium]